MILFINLIIKFNFLTTNFLKKIHPFIILFKLFNLNYFIKLYFFLIHIIDREF